MSSDGVIIFSRFGNVFVVSRRYFKRYHYHYVFGPVIWGTAGSCVCSSLMSGCPDM